MSRIKLCWDTNVYLAWFGEEADKPLSDIATVVSLVDHGEAMMIVPMTVISELYDATMTSRQLADMQKWLLRSNVQRVDLTESIANLAGKLRRTSMSQSGLKKIKLPDAQVLATAVLAGANELHTFDGGLLQFAEHSIVSGMRIGPPLHPSGQKGLPVA